MEQAKFPFRVYQMCENNHEFWVADSLVLKGCTGQGETDDAAVAELAENETVWLETARKYLFEHKGYHGSVEYSTEDQTLYGSVLGVRDILTYCGADSEELLLSFRDCVESYLDLCAGLGRDPEEEP